MKNNKEATTYISNNIWDCYSGCDFNRTPIRYPGGKTRAICTILSLIPEDISVLVSPFIGGGSVEVALSDYRVKVYGYDVFDRLVNFWKCLKNDRHKLADCCKQFLPGNRDLFYKLKETDYVEGFESAAQFIFVNRCSFSGLTYSGGYSKLSNKEKFTEKYIEFINSYETTIEVEQLSFEQSLLKHPNEFIYLDPPYLLSKENNKLYGKKGNTHDTFDHELLKSCLKNHKGKWIMSYNNDDAVKDLYKDFQMVECGWGYSMNIGKDTIGKNKGEKRELLIFSPNYDEIKFRY